MISSRREDSLKRAQDEIKAGEGADILYHAGDASKEEDVTALLSDALEKMGTVDILVNSQGVNKKFPGTEFPADTWDAMFNANVKSVMLTCKHFGRYMKVHDIHGKIINLSSVIGIRAVGNGGGADASYVTFNPKAWERPADYPFPIREPETTFCSGSIRFIRPDPDDMPTY